MARLRRGSNDKKFWEKSMAKKGCAGLGGGDGRRGKSRGDRGSSQAGAGPTVAQGRSAPEVLAPHLKNPAAGSRSEIESLLARERELTTKLRGELAELLFFYLATKLGFILSKPYGDSQRYDFVLDNGRTLYRIQVKCTTHLVENNLYHLNAHRRVNGKAIAYTLDEVDFFAAYVIPDDSWFIIPLRDVLGCTSLMFRAKDDGRPHIYDRYRGAWDLLKEPAGLVIL